MRPRILDLFCCQGGASAGYVAAGFDVVGIDLEPQPRYPYEFHQADALEALQDYIDEGDGSFAAVHASPPCQAFTAYQRTGKVGEYPDLIDATRDLLRASGLPYVIENVEGAPLVSPVRLCGSMFDPPMDIQRHRLFEANWPLQPPVWPCRHRVWGPDRFPSGRSKERTGSSRGLVRGTIEVGSWDIPLRRQQEAMGVDWMTLEELSEAIPPAYTEHIGGYLMRALSMEAAA